MTCFNEEIRKLLEELSQRPKTETFIALSRALVIYLCVQKITPEEARYVQNNYSDPIHLFLSVLQSEDSLITFNKKVFRKIVSKLIQEEIRKTVCGMFSNEKLDDATQDIFQKRFEEENKLFPDEVKPSGKSFRKKVYRNRSNDLLRKEQREKDHKKTKQTDILDFFTSSKSKYAEMLEKMDNDAAHFLYALGVKRRLVWCIYNDMSKILSFWHDVEQFIINRKSTVNHSSWKQLKHDLESQVYPDISTACSYIGMKKSTSEREHRRAKKTLLKIQVLGLALQEEKYSWDSEFYKRWESIPEIPRFCIQFAGNDNKDLWWRLLSSHHTDLSNAELKSQLQLLRKEYTKNDTKTPFLFPSEDQHNQYITTRISVGLNIVFSKTEEE